MVYEARRRSIRFVWAYIFSGMTVAISFTFPLFLIAREFALSHPTSERRLAWYDYLGLVLVTGFVGWLYWFVLFVK